MTDEKPKSKEERIKDFVRSFQAVEEAMVPYKEQRSDLKKNYAENEWLSKNEIKNIIRALRLLKDETDFAELEQMYKKLSA